MSTQELGMFIEREYPYFKRTAYHFTYLYGNRRWIEDILHQALMEVWIRKNELRGIQDLRNYIVTALKNITIGYLRDSKKHNYTNVEDHYFHLEYENEEESILPDEVWAVYREAMSKSVDDGLYFPMQVAADEFSFIPVGCSLSSYKNFRPATDKYGWHKKPCLAVGHIVTTYSSRLTGGGKQKTKVRHFTNKADAVNYIIAVRTLIAQNTPPLH